MMRADNDSIGAVICKRAEQLNASAVVLAKHNKGAIKEFFVGSVTNYVRRLQALRGAWGGGGAGARRKARRVQCMVALPLAWCLRVRRGVVAAHLTAVWRGHMGGGHGGVLPLVTHPACVSPACLMCAAAASAARR